MTVTKYQEIQVSKFGEFYQMQYNKETYPRWFLTMVSRTRVQNKAMQKETDKARNKILNINGRLHHQILLPQHYHHYHE